MNETGFQQFAPSVAQAVDWAREYYALNVEAKKLPGEVDFNFHLKEAGGTEYTLKVSRPGTQPEELDFQERILLHLQGKVLPLALPLVLPCSRGNYRVSLGEDRWLRLQRWVPGKVVAGHRPHTPELLKSWGAACGHLCAGLSDFDHPTAHRSHPWNPSQTLELKKYRKYFQDPKQRALADYFWGLFESEALPQLGSLRQGVHHMDANDYNMLLAPDQEHPLISGVIDFGDSLYTHTLNEPAIACAYACMDKADPIQAAAQLIGGFHEVFPLTEKEVSLLFPMIAARLMITVTTAARNLREEPENDYLQISVRPAWQLLEKLREIPPELAHYHFRQACGWEACPKRVAFAQWKTEHPDAFEPAVAMDEERTVLLDLSVGSLDLGNNANFDSIRNFQRTIDRLLEEREAKFGTGGYGEVRPFYSSDAFEHSGNAGPRWRTVHLGQDIWAEAGTPVFALLDGKVHSIQNNRGDYNYGPTIILKHSVSKDLTFYSLYGHLSLESLSGIRKGRKVAKGAEIARIGAPPENGNWPPHLHLQLILDMMAWEGDFPGVAFPEEREIWLSICPNPEDGTSLSFPIQEDLLPARKQHLGRSLSISYQKPLHIQRGYLQHLYAVDGRRYLDTVNNVAHVGHEHPRVVRTAQRQMAVLNTNTRYLHKQILRFAETLLATFPPELSVVYFVNSGSEANELALRMAKTWSGQEDMLAVEWGYHGNTGACIDVSSYKFDGKGGRGAPPHTRIVPIPDVYRGLYRGDPEAGEKYAGHLQKSIKELEGEGRGVAGFICESILSCGGQIVLPEHYLKEAYRQVRAVGGLCIADEVQVGFGRVGSSFWGFELQEEVPDIVTMGKPMGNGHPLAAVVTTREVAEAFSNGMEYFNTFGGNPVSCAIGHEVLKVIREEELQAHALETGQYLIKGLKNLQDRYPLIGDVRGHGLFLGIELVNDPEQLTPATPEASYLVNRMRELGILMSTDGPYNNVLKIKPPMCFNRSNADQLLDFLGLVFQEDFVNRFR